MDDLIEKVAETIYLNEGGMTPEEYEEFGGTRKRSWRIPTSRWDTDPNELCEWERDEYRAQAKAVLELLSGMGLLK